MRTKRCFRSASDVILRKLCVGIDDQKSVFLYAYVGAGLCACVCARGRQYIGFGTYQGFLTAGEGHQSKPSCRRQAIDTA